MGNSNQFCGKAFDKNGSHELSISQDNNSQGTTTLQQSITVAKIINRPVFHKVNQVKVMLQQFPCDIVLTEDKDEQFEELTYSKKRDPNFSNIQLEDQDEVFQEGMDTLSLQQLLCEQEKKLSLRKIGVNWNSFVKIKKKNYLEDYIFKKEIGKGAYGSVAKIMMKYGGMFRAAKIVKSSLITAQKSNLCKLFAQVSLPMKLDHPNIVKLFQVFEYRGQYVLIQQLCQGGDLFAYIKKNRFFSESKAAHIIKQILSAVNYMHKQRVMHRDLKPENVLVDSENDTLKIGDFGTATPFTAQSVFSDLVGTPYYIAPEVINGSYNQKCDVWSCGIILYILLCGSPPFNGTSDKDILEKIKFKPLDFRNSVWKKRNKQAKQLITKMLNKNPEQRISAEEALNNEWLLLAETSATTEQMQSVEAEVVSNLKSFHFKNKLKAVVYTYIASQLYSNRDKDNLLRVFRQIDKDGDGVIEKNELISIFNNHSRSRLSDSQIEKILQLIDTNGSGMIDFTQFLVAASNEEKMLEEQRLENAFNYLDADHSGYITIEEVKAFLDGTSQTDEQIKKIFNEVDQNGDGNISKQQFIALLLKKD